MDIVKICPTCKETITRSPLVDILVTYQEDLTESEIYEQGWHRKCYPPAPALPKGDAPSGTRSSWQGLVLAVLEMVQKRLQEKPGGGPIGPTLVAFTGEEWTQIDAAIAEARGQAATKDEVARRGQEPYLASYDYSGDM